MRIAMNGRPVTVSTDRVKPAYIMAETDSRTVTAQAPQEQTTQPATQSSTPSPPATLTTRCGRRVRFPARFNVLAPFSAEGVMWKHPTSLRPFSGLQLSSHTSLSAAIFRAQHKTYTS